jgi:ribose 5-phosphate isomerase B
MVRTGTVPPRAKLHRSGNVNGAPIAEKQGTEQVRVALAADHAGFSCKERLKARLREARYEILDLGGFDDSPSDYPDLVERVADALRGGRVSRGIIVCGSGVGASVVANKFPGIRAAVCHDIYSAHQGVEHDDMNILCLGARIVGTEVAVELCLAFLAARFSGEERHRRRLAKVLDIETRFMKPDTDRARETGRPWPPNRDDRLGAPRG